MKTKIQLLILQYVPSFLLPTSVIKYLFTSILKDNGEQELADLFL